MLENYLKRSNLAARDVRYVFQAGDLVLLRQREPGKLKTRAMGPYTFVRYVGRAHM